MPFDGIADPAAAKSLQALDLMEDRLQVLQAGRIQADCTKAMTGLAAASVDFVLTHPPYLIDYQSRDGRSVANDDTSWRREYDGAFGGEEDGMDGHREDDDDHGASPSSWLFAN